MTRPEPTASTSSERSGTPLSLEIPGNTAKALRPFLTEKRFARLEEVLSKRTRRLTAFVENVFDPHNISACMRSSEAFGLQDFHILPQPGLDMRLSSEVSSGSHRWLTRTVHPSLDAAMTSFRSQGYKVYATDLQPDPPPLSLDAVPIEEKVVIAFGNEHEGISDALRDAADGTLALPMHGFVQSFNISVAYALVMHRLRERQIALTGCAGDLDAETQLSLLDTWVLGDLPKAEQILKELQRRT